MRALRLLAAPALLLAASDAPALRVPVIGCPMAHCDAAMSDRVRMRAPVSVAPAWFDGETASKDTGLGCSGNAIIAVCTFGGSPDGSARPHLKAYSADGRVLWDSGTVLNATAWTSVPIVTRRGAVIAADDTSLVRFEAGGQVRWRTPTPGGRPISPTVTSSGTIVLATIGGPVSAYDPDTGEHLATLDLRETLGGLSGRFETTNTPGARGNRIYVSTEFKLEDGSADPNHHARLYAIDVEDKRLSIAWYFEFGARSGASPLVIGDLIVFDGDRASADGAFAPRFFAIRDEGPAPSLVWQYEPGGPGAASAARDPRGGLWVFALGGGRLTRLSERDGAVLQTIDLPVVSGVSGARPWSAMGMAFGASGQPVLIVSAQTPSAPYVMAIDVASEMLVWKHALSEDVYGDLPRGQWPIVVRSDGARVLVFTTRNGVSALAEEP